MTNEIELIKKFQRGDRDAFGVLYDYYYDKMLLFTYKRVQDKQLAEDLVSQTFMKVLDNISKFKLDKDSSFKAWIYKILINETNQYFRKESKNIDYDINMLAEETNDTTSDSIDINIAVEKLPKQVYRDLIHLKYYDELTTDEISQVLDVNHSTVRVYLQRAKTELKTYLE